VKGEAMSSLAVEEQQRTSGTPTAATMTELVAGIVGDVQTLIQQQFAMLRAEVKTEANRATEAAKVIAIGAGAATLGLLLIVIGTVYLLNWLLPNIPLWACWFIVGVPLMSFGAIACAGGWRRLHTLTPVPEKSLKSLQENMSWISNHRK